MSINIRKSIRFILAILSTIFIFIMIWIIKDCFPGRILKSVDITKYNLRTSVSSYTYLIKNDYYTDSYSNENNIYVGSLLDKMDITINYDINFNGKVNGSYEYYVEGILTSNKDGRETWKEVVALSEKEKNDVSSINDIYLNKIFNINLKELYTKAINYKKLTGLDVNLLIRVYVNGDFVPENNNERIYVPAKYDISFPITNKNFSMEIDEEKYDSKTIKTLEENVSDFDSYLFLLATLTLVLLIPICLISFTSLFNLSSFDEYNKNLRSINKKYKDKIKKINKLPVFKKKEIKEVKHLKDIIDKVTDDNYILEYEKDNKESWFIVEKTKIVYIYILRVKYEPIDLSDRTNKIKIMKNSKKSMKK